MSANLTRRRPVEFQVDLYVEALEVEPDGQGVGGPVVGVRAPADRAAAAAVGFVQPGAEDPLELAGGGRVEAGQAQGPVTTAAAPVAAVLVLLLQVVAD
jgi:hypothetical protein